MEKIYFSPKNFLCVISTLLLLFITNSISFAQWAPQGINYQAIARDTAGNPISSSVNLAVKFSIYNDSTSINPVFTETHSTVNTNPYGLFTRVIGSVDTTNFKNILWGSGDKYLLVEIGEQGQSLVPMGRTRLMSVPYALYAKKAGNAWELDGNRIPLTDTAMFIGTVNNKDFIIKTDSIQRIRITSGGNVGIGTGIPAAKLDITGQIKITDGTEGAGKILTSDANGLASWSTGSGTVTSFSADSLQPLFSSTVTNGSTTPHLSFTLDSANAYTIFGNNSGTTGLPTYFSPQLNSSLFQNQGTQNKVLHGDANGNPSWGKIQNSDIDSGTINLATKVTGLLALTNGGTAPVGTPGQILTVGSSGPEWSNFSVDTNSATNAGIVLPGTGNPDKVWKTDASGNPGWRTDSSNVAQPWTLSDSTVYNNNTGNVGIGTTAPAAKLHVLNAAGNGTSGIFEISTISNSFVALIGTTNGTGIAGSFTINNSSNSSPVIKSTTNGIGQAGNFTITNSGSTNDALFVSTNGQNSKALHVNHTGNSIGSTDYGAYVTATGSGTNNTAGYFRASGTATTNVGGYFSADLGTNNYAAIFDKGNVGVGTTAPLSLFHVAGIIRTGLASSTNGTLLFNNATNANTITLQTGGTSASYSLTLPTAQGGANSVLVNNGSGSLSWASAGSLGAWTLTGNTGTVASTNFIGTTDAVDFVTRTNNIERMRVTSAGNLAIGTSTPTTQVRLHVFENAPYSSQVKIENPNASSTAGSQLSFYNNTGNSNFAFMLFGSSTSTAYAGANSLSIGTVGTGKMQLITNNTARVTVDSIGNVGIGTATPTEALDLASGNLVTNGQLISKSGGHGLSIRNSANSERVYSNLNSGHGEFFLANNSATATVKLNSNGDSYFNGGNVGIGTVTPSTNSRLAIKDGHLQSQQTNAPTIDSVVTYNAASQILYNATDMAGKVSILTTTSSGSVKVKFNKPYAVAPIVVITPTNTVAAAEIGYVYVTSTTTGFTVNFIASLNAITHTYNYHVIETQ